MENEIFNKDKINSTTKNALLINQNSIYCVMLRSSKNADQRKQWWYRVAGYSAVAPQKKPYINKKS